MSNNPGGIQDSHYQKQKQQQANNPINCKECGLMLNSMESLEVHVHYQHVKPANQPASHSEETNNNTTKSNSLKREYCASNISSSPGDNTEPPKKKSSDSGSRTSPEHIFGHPPTPQSYQSGSSPYQNQENNTSSYPNYQGKTEDNSPNNHYQNAFPHNYVDTPDYYHVDNSMSQFQNTGLLPQKLNPYRFHGFRDTQLSQFENSQVNISNPNFQPQPTPSPSPNQCDKCGYVCESAALLIEHLNLSHPPPTSHLNQYQSNQHFMFSNEPPQHQQQVQIKTEENAQSEILDLDSHKVVHQVYPDEDKGQNGGDNNQHHILNSNWPVTNPLDSQHPHLRPHQQIIDFQRCNNILIQDQQGFTSNFSNIHQESKMFSNNPKMFKPPQLQNQEFMGNGVTTATSDSVANGLSPLQSQPPNYRPFEQLSTQTSPTVSAPPPSNPTPPAGKSSNWKSNEARRPKTYNCTACNKWFTSSGHLKRHYNTTLHKNAVKSSGQPDPASLPISAHHHPARESTSREDNTSNSPGEEMRSEDTNSMSSQFERSSIQGILPQAPSGPFDRQPAPNIHHTPPLHSPMGHSSMSHTPSPLGNHHISSNLSNLSNGNPPNGEAGLSPNNSRGLQSLNSSPINMGNTSHHGFNMAPSHIMPMENNQFQMYPNELAPHVTQAMAINNLNTTGNYQFVMANDAYINDVEEQENQPLPSFAQFNNAQRYGVLLNYANVGGEGSVTNPGFTTYYSTAPNTDGFDLGTTIYRQDEEDYKLTVLNSNEYQAITTPDNITTYHTLNNNHLQHSNNIVTILPENMQIKMENEELCPEQNQTLKQDYEENSNAMSPDNSEEPRHKCEACAKSFNKACYLTQHNKTFHSGEKPYKCQRCGKRFSCERTYSEHSAKHAGEKPHKCKECPKQFNHKTDLRRHMCLHSGKKPYQCKVCEKGFIRKDHMVKHHETHNKKNHAKVSALR